MLFSNTVKVRMRFSFRLVSGYAHVFVLLSVVSVTLPNVSALSSFIANAHNKLYSFYTRKIGLVEKNSYSIRRTYRPNDSLIQRPRYKAVTTGTVCVVCVPKRNAPTANQRRLPVGASIRR